MRIMALDVGDRRIGIAVSDPLGITAQGLETWHRRGMENDLAYFGKIIQELKVQTLVIGLPRNMDGSEGFQAEKVREFAVSLGEHCGLAPSYVDERLTSMAANRLLSMGEANHIKKKQAVDRMAAVMILQTYMQQNKPEV